MLAAANDNLGQLFDGLDTGNLLSILLIVVAAGLTAFAMQWLLRQLADRLSGRARMYALATVPLLRLLILLVSLTLIIPQVINPTFENLVALIGAFGLAIGFTLKEYVSSIVAGLVTLYELPYRPGDWVDIDGTYGEVQSIGIRAMRMLTPDDTLVIVPHLKLWSQLIHNRNSGSQNLQCVADFYIAHNHDAAQATNTLRDVGLTSPLLQVQRGVSVVVSERPQGTHYRLKAYPIDPREQFSFTTDLSLRGREALQHLGLRLGFPLAGSPEAGTP